MFARCHHDVSQHTTMTQSRFTHVLYASHDRVSFKRESKFKHVFGILFTSIRTHFTSCLTQACPVRFLRTFLLIGLSFLTAALTLSIFLSSVTSACHLHLKFCLVFPADGFPSCPSKSPFFLSNVYLCVFHD